MNGTPSPGRFFVKNCSLAAIATGERANSLMELRDKIATVDEGCIYHSFWGGRLKPQFIHHQHHNDFASWVYHRLNDQVLAEKLSIIDPTEFESLEDLRQDVLEKIENRLDEYEIVLWTRKEDRFHFIRSLVIVFEGSQSFEDPKELPGVLASLSPGSVYYHFIDARSRTPGKRDDFSVWLEDFGDRYRDLIERIDAIDPYFLSLTELREELVKVTTKYFEEQGS